MNGKVTALSERTLTDLGYLPSTLSPTSHKKVWVECGKCHESFLRPNSKLHQLHRCPSQVTRADGMVLKWCNRCELYLPRVQFRKATTNATGLTAWCSTCTNTLPSKRVLAKRMARARLTLSGWLNQYSIQKQSTCANKGVEYDLDVEFLEDLWHRQNGNCHYMKIPLGFGTRSLDAAWLDRMSTAGGYTRDNVVWACRAASCMRNESGYNDFLALLVKLDLYRSSPCRLECRLLHPRARLPTKTRPGDAGHDLYAVESGVVPAGGMVLVSTGVQLSAPSGIYYTIEGRSSLWMQGISPCRGIIDAGYTGEVKVALTNVGSTDYSFTAGDRIAQIIIHSTHDCDIVQVVGFSEDYNERGQNGFGSTGR